MVESPPFYNKISKISASYNPNERALRYSMLNKFTQNQDSNACTDGTALCGQNAICVANDDDSYDVRDLFCFFFIKI